MACVVGMREWMQGSCLCFTSSRIALEESTHLFCSSVRFHCMIFTLHDFTDFYVERVTAHRIKINDHSCFQNLWPNHMLVAQSLYIVYMYKGCNGSQNSQFGSIQWFLL